VSRIYDLSHPYQHQMPVTQGTIRLCCGKSAARPKTGTPSMPSRPACMPELTWMPPAFFSRGQDDCRSALDLFAGRGRLLDVRGEDPIRYRAEYGSLVGEDDVVLLWTGHSAAWGTAAYFQQHPTVHEELARFFVQRRSSF